MRYLIGSDRRNGTSGSIGNPIDLGQLPVCSLDMAPVVEAFRLLSPVFGFEICVAKPWVHGSSTDVSTNSNIKDRRVINCNVRDLLGPSTFAKAATDYKRKT